MDDLEIAQAIADGSPGVLSAAAQDAGEEMTTPLLEAFTLLEAIAQFHAGSGQPTSAPVNIAIHASTPATWGTLQILSEIGRGSCGTVYRAYDPHLDRVVALKLTVNSPAGVPVGLEEGRALARVRHPHVVSVYGAEPRGDAVGVWMELVDGLTLEEELAASGPMDQAALVALGVDLCAAVHAVHEAGLLHCDIKTQNIMRERSGRILLMDLGAAASLENVHRADIYGTPLYLGPEILSGRPASRQTDIYSIGVVLFRLATGAYPVYARTLTALRERHNAPAERRALPPHLPLAMRQVIERALDADPERRFPTASALADALRLVPAHARPTTAHSRNVFLVSAAALVAAVAIALGVARTQLEPARASAPGEVTTRSDDARARYREAERLITGPPPRMSAGAEALLRDAIRYDPQFASAFILLAHTLRNQGKPAGDFLPFAKAAFQHSAGLPDAERHFIVGSWHDMNGFAAPDLATARTEARAALASYQALLAIQPDHAWALTNALAVYRALGDSAEAAGVLARMADAHPEQFRANAEAGNAMLGAGRWEATLRYFDRARISPRPVPYAGYGFHLALIRMLPGYRAWLERRIPDAVQHLDSTAATLKDLSGDEQASTRQLAVWFAFTLGRLDQAEAILANEPSGVVRRMLRTGLARERRDRAAMRTWLADDSATPPGSTRVDLLLLAGLVEEAKAQQEQLERRRSTISDGLKWAPAAQNTRYVADLSRAEIDLAESRPRDALAALPAMASNGGLFDTRALTVKAASLVALNRKREAIDTLNAQLSTARLSAVTHAYDWVRHRSALASLLRTDGQIDAARVIEADLRVLLSAADRAHPLVLELRRNSP